MRKPVNLIFHLLIATQLLTACSISALGGNYLQANSESLTVYKHPFCFCCKKWMKHLEENGMTVTGVNNTDMAQVKVRWRVPNGMQSCHTAVLDNKYVFEGHIPARYIRQYLQDPPDGSIGLAVPGMPEGSPGMYTGREFTPYNIYLLQSDGDYRFFARVQAPEE